MNSSGISNDFITLLSLDKRLYIARLTPYYVSMLKYNLVSSGIHVLFNSLYPLRGLFIGAIFNLKYYTASISV